MLVRGVFLLEKQIENWLAIERKRNMIAENQGENEVRISCLFLLHIQRSKNLQARANLSSGRLVGL
jgi:hypothetical protein